MQIIKRITFGFLIIILLLLITAGVASWYLFQPNNLTNIVNNKLGNYVTCTTHVDEIEPTFFSTMPWFNIRIKNLYLKEKQHNNSKSDTIIFAKQCNASINLSALIFSGDIVIDSLTLIDGYANLKIDKNNKANFDILANSNNKKTENETSELGNYTLKNISINNFTAHFVDATQPMQASINRLNAKLSATFTNKKFDANAKISIQQMAYTTTDSLAMNFIAKQAELTVNSYKKNSNNSKVFTRLHFSVPTSNFTMQGNEYISNSKIDINMPFATDIAERDFYISPSTLRLDNFTVAVDGKVNIAKNTTISTQLNYKTNQWDMQQLMQHIPVQLSEYIRDTKITGVAQCSGTIKGKYNDNQMPIVTNNINYNNGTIRYQNYPDIQKINTKLTAVINTNKKNASYVNINSLEANIRNTLVNTTGKISNLFNVLDYNLNVVGNINLADFQQFIPSDLALKLKGNVATNVKTRFNQSAIDSYAFNKILVVGNLQAKNLNINKNDSIQIKLPTAILKVNMPTSAKANKNTTLANIYIQSPKTLINVSPQITANASNTIATLQVKNINKAFDMPNTAIDIKMQNFASNIDTLKLTASKINTNIDYIPTKNKANINIKFNGDKTNITGKKLSLLTARNINSDIKLIYTPTDTNIWKQWQPNINMSFKNGTYDLGNRLTGAIPSVEFAINNKLLLIKNSSITLGNSDFSLIGSLKNIAQYMSKKDTLRGIFNFTSTNTDVTELMDIFNGFGNSSTTASTEKLANDPFMVPLGMDISFDTHIETAKVNQHNIKNVNGGLTVKDGALILEQMGFTNKAANMQLTAIYRSPRKNHLFTGLDFHLMNIDINELIKLIPDVDTMVPMLKSFDGKGEFHLAAETYLKSNYEPKKSTIRGAAAFKGKDLVLLDNATFSQIAKWLRFEKQTKNKVDSLSVEMTVFRNEVDMYPFLIVMDDYKAVISGRYNLDNSCNYHISVTDSPLPIRLGLDISGNINDLHYSLAKCKYKHLFRPEKQGKVEKETLRLKNMIYKSLRRNVKENSNSGKSQITIDKE